MGRAIKRIGVMEKLDEKRLVLKYPLTVLGSL